MEGDALIDPHREGGLLHGAVELTDGQWLNWVQAREEPPAIEHLALGTGDPPPGAQALEHHRGEHRIAIFAALTLLDAQRHARAIDVTDLERGDFVGAQPRAIGDRERRLMLQVLGGGNQRADLLPTQDDRQGPRHEHRLHLRHQLAAIERDVEEELKSRDRGVERDGRGAAINEVQLEVAQILDRGGIRRSAQIACQLPNRTHVRRLRVGCELAQPHVLQHPLTQRGNLSSGIVHGSAPGCERGGMPHFATYETEPLWSASPTPDKNRPYRASGLVLWPTTAGCEIKLHVAINYEEMEDFSSATTLAVIASKEQSTMDSTPWTVTAWSRQRRETWVAIRLWLVVLLAGIIGFFIPFWVNREHVHKQEFGTRTRYTLSSSDQTEGEF